MHNPTLLTNLYYARLSNNKGEVDMVYLDQNFKVKWCLEVKWTDRYFEQIDQLQNLMTFCKYNAPSKVQVTTKTKRGHQKKEDVQIEFKESAIVCYNMGKNNLCP